MGSCHDNFIGEALAAHGELTCDLIPVGGATYASAVDPDIAVRFEQQGERGYMRVVVIVPYYWYVVTRKSP